MYVKNLPIKITSEDWRDGSVDKVLAVQASGLEFGSLAVQWPASVNLTLGVWGREAELGDLLVTKTSRNDEFQV